jgi:hypothetical protein
MPIKLVRCGIDSAKEMVQLGLLTEDEATRLIAALDKLSRLEKGFMSDFTERVFYVLLSSFDEDKCDDALTVLYLPIVSSLRFNKLPEEKKRAIAAVLGRDDSK